MSETGQRVIKDICAGGHGGDIIPEGSKVEIRKGDFGLFWVIVLELAEGAAVKPPFSLASEGRAVTFRGKAELKEFVEVGDGFDWTDLAYQRSEY